MPTPEDQFGLQPENSEPHEKEAEFYDLPIDLTETQYDPEIIKQTLVAKREEIIEAMHRQHEENLEKLPGYDDSILPGAKVAILSRHVGFKWKNVIERDAYWSNNTGGVFFEMRDLLPDYHPYWVAVAESGFIPEVRMMGEWGSHGVAELYGRLNRPSFSTDD